MNKLTLLIADDEENYRELLYRRLEPLGMQFALAGTFSEAINAMLKEHRPDFVILDLRLPDSPDSEATLRRISQIRAVHPTVPILVLTGDPDQKLAQVANALGADGFRRKDELQASRDLYVAMKDSLEAQKARGVPESEAGLKILARVHELLLQ